MIEQTAVPSVRLVHHTRHRTRLRVPREQRSPAAMAAVADALMGLPSVRSVEINKASGSLLVRHDSDADDEARAAELLGGPAGLALDFVAPREREAAQRETSLLGKQVQGLLARLDAWVAEQTGGWIDLKMLVPLACVGLAAVQLFLTGGLNSASPYILLYAAFDTYVKFHELFPARRAAEAGASA